MTAIKPEKINGISFVASRDTINQTHVEPVVSVNANYAAIMPYGFIRNLESPEIIYNTQRQWYGETGEGAKQYIAELRKQQIKIMLKPHIWVYRGEYTGHIKMADEASWKQLESSYENFILDYAQLAEELNVPILCIGTELEQFVLKRTDYWTTLIEKIRMVYTGEITYAANWDEFKRIDIWKQLDYIGIDAYFPLSDKETPTIEDCRAGWESHKTAIQEVVDRFDKRVLFTEYGYRSTHFAAKEPWRSDRYKAQVNLEAQTNATIALYEEFWDENWFAGGFVWKWFHKHDRAGGEENNMFTPQNKPVEDIIRAQYLNY